MGFGMTTRLCAALLLLTPISVLASDPGARERSFEFVDSGPRELILGKWKPTSQPGGIDSVIEFARGGKLKVSSDQFSFEGKYKFIDDRNIELTLNLGPNQDQSVKLHVHVTRNELSTQEANNNRKETFKRIR
jgi:uncharacterized protein (TIGR03066 family)